MEITINNKPVEVVFGLAFNREADAVHKIEGNGLTFGAGLDTLLPQLLAESVPALSETIYHGTAHIKQGRPSGHQIDKYIEEYSDIDALFEEVKICLEDSNTAKKKLKAWKNQLGMAKTTETK